MIAVQPTQHRGATASRDNRAWHERLFPINLVALGMLAAAPGTASAQSPDMQICQKEDAQSLAACQSIMDSETVSPKDRAEAFVNRGNILDNKGDHDRAIADYDEAIRLSPNFAVAYSARSVSWQAKGDTARANADAETAKRLGN
jgi:tetratricopeptide (TPR) repeat protein